MTFYQIWGGSWYIRAWIVTMTMLDASDAVLDDIPELVVACDDVMAAAADPSSTCLRYHLLAGGAALGHGQMPPAMNPMRVQSKRDIIFHSDLAVSWRRHELSTSTKRAMTTIVRRMVM